MTLNEWLREQDGRCPRCLMHETAQGHRSIDSEGKRTGCRDEGPASAAIVALREAEARKQDAYEHLDRSDTADESTLIRRAIVATGRSKLQFTADDLPADIRQRTNPNRRGRIFSALIDEGVITEVDRVKSLNPRAHGKKVGVYSLRRAA